MEETDIEDDPAIEVARSWAKAFALYRRKGIREEIDSLDFNALAFQDFLLAAVKEDDRSLSILVVGYLDDKMAQLIRLQLVEPFRKILNVHGMLGTLDSRLSFAAALRWIDHSTYNNANTLRKIRNRFAHNVDCSSFRDAAVSDWIRSLTEVESQFYDSKYLDHLISRKRLSIRKIFIARATRVLSDVIIQMISSPFFMRAGFQPDSGFSDEASNIPNVIKDVMRLSIQFTIYALLRDKDDRELALKKMNSFRRKVEEDQTDRHDAFHRILDRAIGSK